MRRGQHLVAAAAALVVATVPSVAHADFYPFADDGRVVTQHADAGPAVKIAYKGPRTEIGDSGTSVDEYGCPGTQRIIDWVAFPDDLDSAQHTLGISSSSTAYFHYDEPGSRFSVRTTNFSGDLTVVRVIGVCSSDMTVFPYNQFRVGDYWNRWLLSLMRGQPDYRQLVIDAFFFDRYVQQYRRAAAAPVVATPVTAAPSGNRFPLRNGANRLALTFRHGSRTKDTIAGRRPPAIFFSTRPAKADCRSRQLYMNVSDGDGTLLLDVTCRGLRAASSATVRIRPAIRRTFHLRKGDGTIRVHLDKPLGRVEPFVYITKHPVDTPCRSTSRRIAMRGRTFDLRLGAHCGTVARNATGRLYVGGLLTP